MIGHPIELLSGVNFEAMISESGGADPTREGLATVVRMLEERFEQDVFMPAMSSGRCILRRQTTRMTMRRRRR